MSGPRIGELFAGYGGLGLGVKAAIGGEVAWVSDVCKFAKDGTAGHAEPHRSPCSILAHRYPDVPNLGDITTVDWSQVEPVDILTGGSPCQDLSHAGKRAGMTDGTRSNLWVAMREAIAQLRPGLVVWENVRGAYSAAADSEMGWCGGCLAHHGRGGATLPPLRALGRVLGDLSDLGYVGGWHGLRAADVGAPHGRFRVFVVATDAQRGGRHGWSPDTLRGSFGRVAVAGSGQGPRLLKTPTSQLAVNGGSQHPDKRKAGGHGPTLADEVEHLLPTPKATNNENRQSLDRYGMNLGQALGVTPLLPTPAVNDMGASYTPDEWDAWTDRMKAAHGNGNGHGKSLSIEVARLVYDESRCVDCGCPEHLHDEGGFCAGRCGGEMCGDRQYVARLLPTPVGADANGSRQSTVPNPRADNDTLSDVNYKASWGEYAAAIARWEALTRPAPAPTQWTEQYVRERARRLAGKDKRPVGRRGSLKPRPQLAPAFVEWMMGLPAGWVTDVPGITRNEALKALGNGVVPQQAEAAVRFLLAQTAVAA